MNTNDFRFSFVEVKACFFLMFKKSCSSSCPDLFQSYCEDTLDPDCPDERFFRWFHSQFGVELLQPYNHRGIV